MTQRVFGASVFFFLIYFLSPPIRAGAQEFVRHQEPEFLTFDELKTVSQDPHPGGKLEAKLKRFWKTPVISNEAYYRDIKPIRPIHPKLGPSLRLVSWNIEKSFRMKHLVMSYFQIDIRDDIIRIAPAPLYNSFLDVFLFVSRLKEALLTLIATSNDSTKIRG